MTRDEARGAWETSGLIGARMKSSGLMAPSGRSAGTYRIQSKIQVWLQQGGFGCGLYCKAFYFKDREAVTFNDNGFIGFAGWADEVNVQPILSAFIEWVEGLKTEVANG